MTTPQELQAKLNLGLEKVNLGLEKARTNSRRLVLIGAGVIFLSLFLSWWSVTKYRVDEHVGQNVPPTVANAAISEKMTPEQKKDYEDRVVGYNTAWEANKNLNGAFYESAFGKDYNARLADLDRLSLKSGTLSLSGISTWTGMFGLLFLIAGAAWYAAPKLKPELEEQAWTIPWVWTALASLFLIALLLFYFGVPDVNAIGNSYTQGLSLGIYLAMLGAAAVVLGGTFEGIKSANERLAQIAERGDEEASDDSADDDGEQAAPAPTRPRKAPAPPPVDERAAAEEAKRKRLTDW